LNAFDEFLKDASPPSEPFEISTRKGRILMFQGIGDIVELESVRAEAAKFAKSVQGKQGPVEWHEYSNLPFDTLCDCHMLGAMMAGVKLPMPCKDGEEQKYKQEEPWDRVRWMSTARRAAQTFKIIVGEVDIAQLGYSDESEDAAIETAKNA
jgi:hypothetical protein